VKRRQNARPVPALNEILLKTLQSGKEPHGTLTIGKRGVYLIGGDSKLKTFRLVSWEQILERLRA